jgi:hypothetical protein
MIGANSLSGLLTVSRGIPAHSRSAVSGRRSQVRSAVPSERRSAPRGATAVQPTAARPSVLEAGPPIAFCARSLSSRPQVPRRSAARPRTVNPGEGVLRAATFCGSCRSAAAAGRSCVPPRPADQRMIRDLSRSSTCRQACPGCADRRRRSRDPIDGRCADQRIPR